MVLPAMPPQAMTEVLVIMIVRPVAVGPVSPSRKDPLPAGRLTVLVTSLL